MTTPRYPPIPIAPVDDAGRRHFLKLMAASMALAGSACSGPPGEQILPYVDMPENLVPGRPVFYASSVTRRGYAQGVLVESNMGRPTKVEGNPGHPASIGATDVFAQASILQLWDPDRSQTVQQGDTLATWPAFEQALLAQRTAWSKDGGASLRILTGTITSPTQLQQLDALLAKYPQARWHCWDPLHDDGAAQASQLAFGQHVDTLYRLDRADVVLTLDADLFGDWPGSIAYARDFVRHRRQELASVSRLYAMETTPGITGAFADNRVARPLHEIERSLWRIAGRLGLEGGFGTAPDEALAKWESSVTRALSAARGRSLIIAGPNLTAATRALVHLLNARLGNFGNTVLYIVPVAGGMANHAESITALAADMRSGQVGSLFILDANPVYDAPADLEFGEAMRKVAFSAHLGLYRDETARSATWHLPQTHSFEQWSDARAFDGTAGIVQPVMAPLYAGRSMHELLALLAADTTRNGHALVQNYWQQLSKTDFAQFWQTALRTGVIGRSAAAVRTVRPGKPPTPPALESKGIRVVFAPDPSTAAGEFANNGWLQELPRPLTKLTWDNAALLSPATAKTLGVATGDVVRLRLSGQVLDAPVWVLDLHADGAITLPLGYGRQAAGRVGDNVGFDAYRLRTLAALRGDTWPEVSKTGAHHVFAARQVTMDTQGRDIVRMADAREFRRNPGFARDLQRKHTPEASLYPETPYKEYKWGMSIDLNACIGCNACTIACQAENNIPVVGKEEVLRGREMHWIRVDRYEVRGRSAFQPVPCMHCEKAPCEEVCPVGATVHDSEGLNVQVYNRCVGTRFCSNNCPYKVRRFNFLQYSNKDVENLKAAQNPEVTVRGRGVMEKCTYCLQRITRARLDAEKLGRRIQDGEVVTACQAVCPTEAIIFGDLNDPSSKVNRTKASTLEYALLAELNTRPRTTYTARVVNSDPELE